MPWSHGSSTVAECPLKTRDRIDRRTIRMIAIRMGTEDVDRVCVALVRTDATIQ